MEVLLEILIHIDDLTRLLDVANNTITIWLIDKKIIVMPVHTMIPTISPNLTGELLVRGRLGNPIWT